MRVIRPHVQPATDEGSGWLGLTHRTGRRLRQSTSTRQQIRRPRESIAFDYEAKPAVVIGKPGHRIPRDEALDLVVGRVSSADLSAT
jgi:2-keto-4-pentenoate hydratase/2-oxohepta-3-ene-1,7-dioic acid hydratase in catechol pathway